MPREVEVQQRIDAPRESIWRACATPEGIANWQADHVEGQVRVGGKLRLFWAAFGARVELEVTTWEPSRKLCFKQGTSNVEFHLQDRLLTVVQRDEVELDDPDGLRSSWTLALAQLGHCVERHPGRKRRVKWLVSEFAASPELIYLALTEPILRDRWLTETTPRSSAATLGAAGDSYVMKLAGGPQISGRVIANVSGRDVGLTCAEAGEATLQMRTLPSPTLAENRIVALVWSTWGAPTPEEARIVRALDPALARLPGVAEAIGHA